MVAYFNYLFNYGIAAGDLGKMTAFFNPDGNAPFSQSDWDILMTRPPDAAYYTMDAYQNSNILDGYLPSVEVYWWTPDENPRGDPTITIMNLSQKPILYFLIR